MRKPNKKPSFRALAKRLGVSPATVFRFKQMKHAPGMSAPVADWQKFITNNSQRLALTPEAASLRDRKTLEEIRKLKLANDLKESALLRRVEVERQFAEMVSALKGAFNNMPRIMATELSGLGPVEIEARLLAYVDKAFEELKRTGRDADGGSR